MQRPIYDIAEDIFCDWSQIGKGVSPYAEPYLDALRTIESIDDKYIFDTADSVVRYFLANASTYRGEKAKQLKSELKQHLTY
jgi:hypothetical protein